MAKFIIECPVCHSYAEAKTGFFARKKIDCSCGNVIDVRTEKLSSRVCPHCSNTVVYDVSKGEKAICPICKEPINTMSDISKVAEFFCKQCGVSLHADKAAATFTCPVCDFVNDVQERLAKEKIKHDGVASIIKYEGDSATLVWKHPIEDFNYGSQLIVHESQEAIFFKDGQALDLFGAGRYALETQQLPMLEKAFKLTTDTESTFRSEVYYINIATHMGNKWGTNGKVKLFDPATGLHVALGAYGEFNIRVADSRKFLIKVVGTTGGFKQSDVFGNGGSGYFRPMIDTNVKSYLAQAIKDGGINVLEIDARLMELSEQLKEKINAGLSSYGLEITEFFVQGVMLPDDPEFEIMRKQHAERYLRKNQADIEREVAEAERGVVLTKAETAAQVKIIGAQGDAEAYRLKAEAEAKEMQMKGYTYQQETARQVGLEAMKNGLTGNEGGGAGGIIGEVAGLGMTLGTMGGVIGMTKEAMQPMFAAQPMNITQMTATPSAAASSADTWSCPACGAANIKSKFCPECGKSRPVADTWNCPECGAENIKSKFCPECGKPRPSTDIWNCPECGAENIKSKFCPECGKPRPVADTWNCPECGAENIKSKFCPECGKQKGE